MPEGRDIVYEERCEVLEGSSQSVVSVVSVIKRVIVHP